MTALWKTFWRAFWRAFTLVALVTGPIVGVILAIQGRPLCRSLRPPDHHGGGLSRWGGQAMHLIALDEWELSQVQNYVATSLALGQMQMEEGRSPAGYPEYHKRWQALSARLAPHTERDVRLSLICRECGCEVSGELTTLQPQLVSALFGHNCE